MTSARHPFPVLRFVAPLWLAVFLPAYAHTYGLANFLHLCDIAVILTCVGLWRGSPLLLSTQALSSLVLDLIWQIDLVAALFTGRHPIGGTEYMWDPRWPMWVRLISLFHVWLPLVLLWGLSRVGYDRRAWPVQAVIGTLAIAAGRFANPAVNINYAYADPFFHRQWGPGPVHIVVIAGVLVTVVYGLTHLLLSLFPAPADRASPDAQRGQREGRA